MKENKFLIKTIEILIIISLYYIFGKTSIFIYVLSLSLYNIFSSCLTHISCINTFNKYKDNYTKTKFLNIIMLTIEVFSLLFLLLGIFVSDIVNSLLNLNDTFLVFLFMGLSIPSRILLNIICEYFNSIKRTKISNLFYKMYYLLEFTLLLIISIFTFRIFKLDNYIAISLLYLSKIIAILVIIFLTYMIINMNKLMKNNNKIIKYSYKKELKQVLTNNHMISIINIVKNSYFYISIIILYLILITRYNYAINIIHEDITFIYFYFLSIINYLVYIINLTINKINNKLNIRTKIYNLIKIILPISIILIIISPLICKILFNNSDKSIYFVMVTFLLIILSLYEIIFEYKINTKLVYISLLIGIILKLITTIPLINSFYRMGYNLIYGDILSTAIAMTITIIINYTYLLAKNKEKKEKNYFIKVLNTLYENIILGIILIITQFIIPIKTDNYIYSLILIFIYLTISYLYFKIKKKYLKE
ncbi:MAG: hypothetical protein IJZ79_06310 [Bacilli bacterium]|nr:hypothetical protein [Bacilli bacterium]